MAKGELISVKKTKPEPHLGVQRSSHLPLNMKPVSHAKPWCRATNNPVSEIASLGEKWLTPTFSVLLGASRDPERDMPVVS